MTDRDGFAARVLSRAAPIFRRDAVRPVTRLLTNLHSTLYRLTGGRAQVRAHPTALLTVTGRRTGKPWSVPVVYITDGDRYVIAASYAGSDRDPTWWLNLQAHPEADFQVGRHPVRVTAQLASPEERGALWRRLVQMYPPFASYQRSTTREIPVIVLRPVPPDR